MRTVLAGAIIGGPTAAGFGVFVVMHAEEARLRTLAQDLIVPARVRQAEIFGVQNRLDQSGKAPCSDAELNLFRTVVISSNIIQDIARRDEGRIACSALFGRSDISIPALSTPGHSLSPRDTVWRDAILPAAPGRKFLVVGHGDFVLLIRPGQAPTLVAEDGLEVARFVGDPGARQVAWIAGPPEELPSAMLHDGAAFWHKGSYVAVACSKNQMICLAVAKHWCSMLRRNLSPFEVFGLAGALTGIAVSLAFATWLRDRASILRRLQRAISRGELALVYQPIINAQTKAVVGVEALMRWPEASGEGIGPDIFIPLAEEGGLISLLSCFAIRTVSNELGPVLRINPHFTVSINIVADDLDDERFHAALAAHITGDGISPSQIALELTERRSAQVEAANAVINKLRRAGYRIYVDDFGTGFSSLSYLSDLSVDAIKLDKSFTSTVDTETVRARLVPPILDMAKDIGVPVIVEGVETENQAAYFRAHGVSGMQGWLFGRPVEAAKLMQSIQFA
jgi:sensor c-di-GMP phosphodiesterase-like protein